MVKILLLILLSDFIYASYDEGRKIFDKKCSACHREFISIPVLINNFTNDNKILNLQAPAFNRVVHKILYGSKAVVNIVDLEETKKQDILEYLEDYLTSPRFSISVSNIRSRKIYPEKKTMRGKVSKKEYLHLVDYIFDYEKHFKPYIVKKKVKIKESKLLSQAKKQNKKILIEAVRKNCNKCKFMKKKVLSNILVKKELRDKYIFKRVYIDKYKLPFGLEKQCNKVTPSYFILDKNGKLKHIILKTMSKKDFLKELRKHSK